MVVSEIDYHLVLLPSAAADLDAEIKNDLAIIIPDLLIEFRGAVKKLKIAASRIVVHFSAGPEFSPCNVAETIIKMASLRLKRRHERLEGFGTFFSEHYYLKSGKEPTRTQVDDFISVVTRGI